jgi:formate dehydrogenase alpha subunit
VQPITITLNGREVSGYPGMTILELARESGIDIPTLCHDPHLTSSGACRVCLVEDEASGRLMASCVTPIAAGMVINTHSPRVTQHRRNIVKLVLASHPDSCLVCDKGNRCQLRQLATDLGIGLVDFQKIPQTAVIEEVNPFIERDTSKCIMCAKCIRACQELVVEGAIDYFHRGFSVKPATLGDLPLEASECTFCGTCVAMCPTGALTEKEKSYRGTTTTTVETTCPFCGSGCAVSLEVKDGLVVRATPGEADAVNRGALCVRGSYGYDFIHSPDRLTRPLVKTDDGFEEVSWEEALDRVATRFNRIRDEHGADSLAVLGSPKCTNEENYLLQRFARCVLGTNNIDNGSRLYNAATQAGLGPSTGFPGSTNTLRALEQSEVILVVGADPPSSTPAVAYAIKRAVKNKGARLILIDPRRTKLSAFAHIWLRPKVGSDIALLNGLAKAIVDEGLTDEEFVARKTNGFEAVAAALAAYSPERVDEITAVPGEVIRAAARLYASAGQAAIVYGTGITQHENGADAVQAVANLALLTGNVGRRGGGIFALQRENNGQGACDMGALPDFLAGYQSVADDETRARFGETWGADLPANPGLNAIEILRSARKGEIKGLYVVGENPLLGFPEGSLAAEALAEVDFLVVQDIFLTGTAKLADVVLPAASFAEKDGTFTNFEGRVSRVRKAIDPVGESLPDWEAILRLAEKMDCPMPYTSPQQVMDEVERLVPLYDGINYSDLDTTSLHHAEMGGNHMDSRRVSGGQFLTGFCRFSPVEYAPQAARRNGDYPFALLTGSILHHLGTGTRTSRAGRLKKHCPQARLDMNRADAEKLGLASGDYVKVISPVAEVTAAVRVADTTPEGTVFLPLSFPESPAITLFSVAPDTESRMPSLKLCNVRIERV